MLTLAAMGALAASAAAEPVSIVNAADEEGKGFTVAQNGRCYVIAPEHVARSDAPLKITGPGRTRGTGTIIKEFKRESGVKIDLAIVELAAGSGLACSDPVPQQGAVDKALRGADRIVLRRLSSTGSITQSFEQLREYNETSVTVTPQSAADQARASDSGSLLIAGGVPVAMVLSLQTDGNKSGGAGGAINAVRIDTAMQLVNGYFASLRDASGAARIILLNPVRLSAATGVGAPRGNSYAAFSQLNADVDSDLARELADIPTMSDVRLGGAPDADVNFVVDFQGRIAGAQTGIRNACSAKRGVLGSTYFEAQTPDSICINGWEKVRAYDRIALIVQGVLIDQRTRQQHRMRNETTANIPQGDGSAMLILTKATVRSMCVAVKETMAKAGIATAKIRGEQGNIGESLTSAFAGLGQMFGGRTTTKVSHVC